MHEQSPFSSAAGGGYFGGSTPATSWPTTTGYGQPSQLPGGAVPSGPSSAGGLVGGVPPFVAVAAGFLLLAAAGAFYAGLAGLMLLHATHATVGGGTGGGGVAGRAVLLLINGAANIYLAYLLVRGQALGRLLTTGVCTWWILYWLYEGSRVQGAFHHASQFSNSLPFGSPIDFGQIGTVTTLGLLLLSGWAAVTAALLWMSSASQHFR